MAQSEHFKDELLLANPDLRPDQIELKVIKTSGDKFKTENLASMGGKGLFVKEIEQELLENNIDCAQSILFSRSSCSISFTKRPLPPMLAKFSVLNLSPDVLITLSSI